MKKVATIVLIGGTCCLGAFWLARSSGSKSAGTSVSLAHAAQLTKRSPGDEASMSQDLQRLEQRVSELSARTSQNAMQIAGLGAQQPAPAEPPPSNPAPPEDFAKEAEATRQQQLASLQARLASEPVDANWSRQAERDIGAVLDANVAGSSPLSIRCASTVCQAVLQHDKAPESQMAIVSAIASQAPFRTGVMYEFDFNASPPKTTLWIMRDQETVREL